MGQNKINNNNNNLTNNNVGQDVGQSLGQRDRLKQKAFAKLGLSHSLSQACPTQKQDNYPKKQEKQILSHCPTVPEETPGTKLKIKPMEFCLHGKKCRHLDGPGGCRPMCKAAGMPVFDLEKCPKGMSFIKN